MACPRGVKAALVVLLGAALVALTATAVPATAPRAAKPKKACDLLERSEIERVLGERVGRPQLASSDLCYWQIGDPEATAEEIGMTLLVDRGHKARSGFEQGLRAIRPEVRTGVDGLGKDAYFAVGTIAVLKSKTTGLYISGVPEQAQAERLARIALGRA